MVFKTKGFACRAREESKEWRKEAATVCYFRTGNRFHFSFIFEWRARANVKLLHSKR